MATRTCRAPRRFPGSPLRTCTTCEGPSCRASRLLSGSGLPILGWRVSSVVVVGGGLAGLTAAYDLLAGRAPRCRSSSRARTSGGKLRRAEVGGVVVDVGAESMLNRRPEGVELARCARPRGRAPGGHASSVWTRGAVRPLPRSLMGVPLDLDELRSSGVLSDDGVAAGRGRAAGRRHSRRTSRWARWWRAGSGDEVVDRLVEPLLGGVYAGHARGSRRGRRCRSWSRLASAGPAARRRAAARRDPGVRRGAGRHGPAGRDARRRAGRTALATGAGAAPHRRRASRSSSGRRPHPRRLEADAVVLATPAAPTARLLADLAPAAAAELAGIEYASMAVVTLAFPRHGGRAPRRDRGFLVPPVDGRAIKASTFSFAKWEWVRDAGAEHDVLHLRTSLGRHGEEAAAAAHRRGAGRAVPGGPRGRRRADRGPRSTPTCSAGAGGCPSTRSATSTGWPGSGRGGRVPGLAVCGAAYDGRGDPGRHRLGSRAPSTELSSIGVSVTCRS